MRVIGLDISTTTIGICVLDVNSKRKIKLVYKDYYKPNKNGTICERLYELKQYFIRLFNKYKPDYLAVEEYIQFMSGGSGAKTIIPLALFNRTVCLTYYELYKKNPCILNVLSIRNIIKEGPKPPKKEDIPELVHKILGIKPEYLLKLNRRTKLEELMQENYDIADAMAVALAFVLGNKDKEKYVI